MSNTLQLKETKCNSFCQFHTIVSYCFDCPALLCKSCQVSMHEIKENTNHQIFEIKNDDLQWGDQAIILSILENVELPNKIFVEVSRDLSEKLTPVTPKPQPNFFNGSTELWACKFCTLDNPSSAIRCQTCNNFPTGRDTGIDYKMKLETFNSEMLPKFRDLDGEHQKNPEISIEHIINCYTNGNSQDIPILSWYRDSYPNLKSFSFVNKIIEEKGFAIRPDDLGRLCNAAVKQENQMLLSYITKQDIKAKLLTCSNLLDPSNINVLNKIENNVLEKQITEQELWEIIIQSDIYTEKDIRMLITELDLDNQEQINTLRAFINDLELGDYLKESYPAGRVKMHHLRQAVTDHIEIAGAINFLRKTCEICYEDFPMPEIYGLVSCEHEFCKNCAFKWFRQAITDKYPIKWNCPYCPEEQFGHFDKNMYYSQLRMILSDDKSILSVFEEKLLTEQLRQSKHFFWCANEQCTNGFEAEGVNHKIQCSHCRSFMCVDCKRIWHEKHDDKSCKEFELWMLKHDDLADLLKNIGIECPNCGMRYALAPGGCLHFDCKACGVKFCGGCYQLFVDKCGKPKCAMNSFHGHHPRNCLYFLRDYSADELEKMLKGFDYPKLEGKPEKQCQFLITVDKTLKDEPCNKEVHNTTGMCEVHYKEYLVQFINRYKIDPADFVDSQDLNMMLFQMVLDKLNPLNNETDVQFKERLKKHVKDNCLFYIPKSLLEDDE